MWTRRSFLQASSAAALVPLPTGAGSKPRGAGNPIIIDGQGGIGDATWGVHPGTLTPSLFAKDRSSGLTACSTTVATYGNDWDAYHQSLKLIAEFDRMVATNKPHLLKVLQARDILAARDTGRIGLIFNTQDTSMVGPDLDRLSALKDSGIRVVQLTYNNRNLSGDGCLERSNAGISKLGVATIERIEEHRLLLDLSHSGQRTTAEGIAAANRPPTISHTGCRALNDHPRNQWDAELRACANKGGVVGIYWMSFLVPNGKTTGADLVRHMEHARQVCGEDHVAIGTDGIVVKTVIDDAAKAENKRFYEDRKKRGIAAPGEGPDIFDIVADWDDERRFEHLAHGLTRAGWAGAAIEKALGGNLLRLYRETWGA